jgi:hypothetical protein
MSIVTMAVEGGGTQRGGGADKQEKTQIILK